MALTKYRVGTTVTIAPATVTADHAGGKTISGTSWSSLVGETFRKGQVVLADPVAGSAANLLFTALSGAGLVAVTTDADADHSAISN